MTPIILFCLVTNRLREAITPRWDRVQALRLISTSIPILPSVCIFESAQAQGSHQSFIQEHTRDAFITLLHTSNLFIGVSSGLTAECVEQVIVYQARPIFTWLEPRVSNEFDSVGEDGV